MLLKIKYLLVTFVAEIKGTVDLLSTLKFQIFAFRPNFKSIKNCYYPAAIPLLSRCYPGHSFPPFLPLNMHNPVNQRYAPRVERMEIHT